MYKQLKLSVLKELEESGNITLTAKRGWEAMSRLLTVPYHINYQIGTSIERIFNCYLSIYGETVEIADIEPGSAIVNHKNLIDAYLSLAIQGIIDHARSINKSRIVIDSCIPPVAEHLADKGFKVMRQAAFSSRSIKGVLDL